MAQHVLPLDIIQLCKSRTLSCGVLEADTTPWQELQDPEWRVFIEAGKLNDNQECNLKKGRQSKTISFSFKKKFSSQH